MGKQARATAEFLAGLAAQGPIPEKVATRLARNVGNVVSEAVIVGNEYGPGTPVDTGAARGAWVVTTGPEGGNTDVPEHRDPSGATTVDAAQLAIAGFRLGDAIVIENGMDYIEKLNTGWSQQAPAGMTDSVVAAFGTIVQREGAKLGLKGN